MWTADTAACLRTYKIGQIKATYFRTCKLNQHIVRVLESDGDRGLASTVANHAQTLIPYCQDNIRWELANKRTS